jgi:hypothetical protein
MLQCMVPHFHLCDAACVGAVLLSMLCLVYPLQCIRKLDRTSINGYRLTVERAKTDLK